MNESFKTFGLASMAACVLSLSAHAATVTSTFNGNGSTGFGGPVGNGVLTLTSDATTLSGTIAPGPNNGAGANGELYDELVIYISTNGTTGFTSTRTLTDTTTTNANLARAVSGYDGTNRSTINFATGFAANYAIAISPVNASLGELYGLTSAGAFTAIQSVNLSPTGGAGNPDYTFNLALSNIGSPANFNFSTTYLNAHPNGSGVVGIYRAGEAFNTVTDTTTPGATNPGTDTVTLGVNNFVTGITASVPEPSTWAIILGGLGLLVGFQRRSRRV